MSPAKCSKVASNLSAETIRILKISNKRGLHARASAKFVECAAKYDAEIRVSKDGHIVGGTSIMGLMMLAAGLGSDIHISATGIQAAEAIDAIADLIDNKFGESE
ncbi:MAG: HPr family phosphocarrier protein [Pseudomonadota bacterium]